MDIKFKALLHKTSRLQAAIDFMMSYGIALLAIGITLAILYKVGLTPYNTPNVCTPNPGFSCTYFRLSSNGVLNLTLAQATGQTLTVNGIACSSSVNSLGDYPEYGNVHVANAMLHQTYYPITPFSKFTFYTGTAVSESVTCYNSGGTANGILGNTFTGYIWMNYTTVPSTSTPGNDVYLVASFSTKYS